MHKHIQFLYAMITRALHVSIACTFSGCTYTVDSFNVTSAPRTIGSLVVEGEATYSTDFDRLTLDLSLENHGDHEYVVPMSGFASVGDTKEQESIEPLMVERRWRPIDKPSLNEQNDPLDETGYDYDNLVLESALPAAVDQIASVHAQEKVKLKLHFDIRRFEEGTISYSVKDVTDGSTNTIVVNLKRVSSAQYPYC